MAQYRHLSKAPINEALVNFQSNATERWAKELVAKFKKVWPSHKDVLSLQEIALRFSANEGQEPHASATQQEVTGWLFRSGDEPTVHQVRRDGYTFSQLKPYQYWENLEARAHEGWKIYNDVLKPEPLYAVAARFINQLEFPASATFDLSEYFTAPPKPPVEFGWTLFGFVQHSQYNVPDSPCSVRINLAPGFSANSELYVFMLDIEVTLKKPLAETGKALSDIFSEMRRIKNEAFFGMLTEKAVQLHV